MENEKASSNNGESLAGYWNVALSQCSLQPSECLIAFKCIDFYGNKECSLWSSPQLFALVCCILSVMGTVFLRKGSPL